MRVLHAAPYLWSGAGNVITRLVEAQVERHVVGLVTSPRAGELSNWPAYDRRVSRSGAWHQRIDLFHREGASFWAAVGEMRAAIEQFEPDILHTHAGTPTAVCVLARAASSRPATPLVSHFYSWGVDRPTWMNAMDLWAFGRADAVICSARGYQAILKDGGVSPRRLRLLPWGLPVPADPPRRRDRGDRGPVIGTLGRIERRKGQLDLVHAFARVRDRWPNARLDLVGPVAEEAYATEIRAAIDRLGLRTAVRLTGHVADPRRHLARWSVYVSLSSDEGQGLAVLEAMASGVPVVALRAAGVEDYLRDGVTGLAAGSRSPREVARLISDLLDDAATASRLSRSAFAMVRRTCSWDRTVTEIESVYRSHAARVCASARTTRSSAFSKSIRTASS